MRNADVRIGAYYSAKVSSKITVIKILAKHSLAKGWTALNCHTNVHIHIRSAQRLRADVTDQIEDFKRSSATGVLLGQKGRWY